MINTDKKTTASNEKLISKKRVPMIISLLIIIASLLVIIISIHFKKQDSCLVDNDTEKYLNPSEETMEIAKTAVEKLQLGVVFFPGLDVHKSVTGVYNDTAKWVAPELLTLETKQDASIALIKIYEDMLEEYRSCNLERFYENLISGNNPTGDILTEHNKIVRLQVTRMVIEALLALDCYYDLLDTYNIQRLTDDFNEYLIIDNYYTSKYFNYASTETMFEMYRRGDYL